MIDNPFAVLERRLNRQEFLLEEIKTTLSKLKNPQAEQPDRLNKEQTLEFLAAQGAAISESQLYKLTASKQIPFEHFGRKLIFSRKELLNWVESQTVDPSDNSGIELTLARSARRKKKGVHHA